MEDEAKKQELLQWAQNHLPGLTKIEDLADGVGLVKIIQTLSMMELRFVENPKKFKHRLQNAKVAIRTAEEYGIPMTITPEDVVSGDVVALTNFLEVLNQQAKSFRARSASQLTRYSRSYENNTYEPEHVKLGQACIRRYLAVKALSRLRKKHSHRNQVATEILKSEQVYVDGLEALVAYKDQLEFNLKVSPEPLMTREQINDMFLNCSEIFNYNKIVLEQLSERINDWSDSQKLGDIFIQMAPYLKLYQFYCNAYDNASRLCDELRKRPVMEAFLAGVMAQAGTGTALPLEALLIMPVQRVPRYILLLKDLIAHTNPEHPDYEDLCEGLHKIQGTANTVNNSIRQAEMMNKVYSIQERIAGSDAPVLLEPGRFFVHEGPLSIVHLDSKKNKKEFDSCWFFLFNDALVYVGAKSFQFRGMLNFNSYQVRMKDIPDMGVVSNAIMLVSSEQTITLACQSFEDKMEWMSKISNQLARTLQAQHSRNVEEEDDGDDLMAGVSATITGTEVRQDKSKNKFTVYTILVSSRNRTYTVFHRYSEFDTLYHKLKKKFPDEKFVALPKKHILGNLGSNVVESRQVMLEGFLEDILMKPHVYNSSDFVIFLQPSDNYSAVTEIKKDKKKMKLIKEDKKRRDSSRSVRLPPGVSRQFASERPMSSASVDMINPRKKSPRSAGTSTDAGPPTLMNSDGSVVAMKKAKSMFLPTGAGLKPLPQPPEGQPPAGASAGIAVDEISNVTLRKVERSGDDDGAGGGDEAAPAPVPAPAPSTTESSESPKGGAKSGPPPRPSVPAPARSSSALPLGSLSSPGRTEKDKLGEAPPPPLPDVPPPEDPSPAASSPVMSVKRPQAGSRFPAAPPPTAPPPTAASLPGLSAIPPPISNAKSPRAEELLQQAPSNLPPPPS